MSLGTTPIVTNILTAADAAKVLRQIRIGIADLSSGRAWELMSAVEVADGLVIDRMSVQGLAVRPTVDGKIAAVREWLKPGVADQLLVLVRHFTEGGREIPDQLGREFFDVSSTADWSEFSAFVEQGKR